MKLHVAELAILLCFLFSSSTVQAQECTERFMKLSVVEYRAQQIGTNAVTSEYMDERRRFLREYQFNCSSTNITSLILGIDVLIATGSRTLFPSVQVFRPGNGNNYNLVTGSERTIYYSTSNVSEVFEYPLNPPIPVMSGDLLAVSQPNKDNSVIFVRYIHRDISGISFSSTETNYDETTADLGSSPDTDLFFLVYPVTDGYCVDSTNSINASVIRNNALRIHDSQRFAQRQQYLYPEIIFFCNGTVTKWIYGAVQDTGASQPELQIWRQLGPNNYNKTGSSSVNAGTMNGTNLYEFIPQTPLQFQEGDIFGVHIPSNSLRNLIMYEQDGSGPINYRVGGNVNDPLSTITEALTSDGNDFPLVTVEVSVLTPTFSLLSAEIEAPSSSIKTSLPVISITSVISTTLTSMISTTMTSSSLMIATTQIASSITMMSMTPISSFVAISSAAATPSFVIHTTPSHIDVISTPSTPSATSTNSAILFLTDTSLLVNSKTHGGYNLSVSSISVTNTVVQSSESDLITSTSKTTFATSTTSTNTVPLPALVSSAVIIGGITGFLTVACLVTIITLSIIVCVIKKRAQLNPLSVDIPLEVSPTTFSATSVFAISNIEDNPAYVASSSTLTETLDNPAYESATKLNDNPAYGSRSTTDNPACASTEYAVVEVSYAYPDTSNFYDTAKASPDQDDNEYVSL